MSDVPAEVVARGRAIFERLRGAPESEDASSTPSEPSPPGADEAARDDEGATSTEDAGRSAADLDADDGAPAEPSEPDGRLDTEPASEPEAASEPDVAAEPAPMAEDARGDAEVGDERDEPEGSAPAAVADDGGHGASNSVSDEIVEDAQVRAEPELPADLAPLVEPTAPPVEPAGPAATDAVAPPPPGAARTPDARSVLAEGGTTRFERPLPRVIAVANQKGGVGKTTTTVNLAACLADLGFRTLVVDLDPQGNASTGVGVDIRDLASSMYDVLLHDAPMEDCIEATSVRNLYVAPANLELAGAEIELVPAFSRELKLRAAIDSVRDDYDFVFVDCPPSLGLLTVNSLAAASEVLVPIQCEYYALEGLGQLLRNVGLVQKNLNPALEVSVIVCVMYDARTKLADQVVAEVRSHFGEKVCRTVVPRTVRLSEAPSYGQPISAFDPSSRGAIAYRELAKEVSGGSTPHRAG